MKARTKLLLGVGIAALALAGPSSALADEHTDDATVEGLGIDELAVVVTTPPNALLLGYAEALPSASVVTVTSTKPWALSIRDADGIGSGTPGRMSKVDCITRNLLIDPITSLTNPLQWSADLGENYNALTDANAQVTTGSLAVTPVAVTFRQTLDPATDEVALADCYQLTATYTVTDNS